MADRRKITKAASLVFYAASIILLVTFLYIVYGNVFSKGVCRADDAYIAMGAKNLAYGYGYATSIPDDGSCGLYYFSPLFSTGPTLSLPTAFLIRIFGNKPWVPGFTSATFTILLLVIIFLTVRKKTGTNQALTYFLLLLFLLYNFTAFKHFPQWCALLGEIPAALLSVLGMVILAFSPHKRSSIIISCLAFGLAFMSKTLSLLGFIPVLVWFGIMLIRQKSERKKLIVDYLLGITMFLLPFMLFDLYKLSVLGVDAYIDNYQKFFGVFKSLAISQPDSQASLTESPFAFFPLQRFMAFREYFRFSLYSLILISMLVVIVISVSKRNKNISMLYFLLLAGSFFHMLWWTCISNGRPRYALIGMFLYFAAISCIVLLDTSLVLKFFITVVMIVVFQSGYTRLMTPVSDVIKDKYAYTPYVQNHLKTVRFLRNMGQNRPFIYTWWASAADIEYSLPTVANFKRIDHLDENDFQRELIMVKNTKWDNIKFLPPYYLFKSKPEDILLDAPPFQVVRYRNAPTALTMEHPVDFTKNGNSGDYITFGWGLQEPNYRWTTRPRAGLNMKLDNRTGSDLMFRILCSGYLGNGTIDAQVVHVLFNHKSLAQWTVDREQWFEVTVPSLLINDSVNTMIFEISRPMSPAACGSGNDTRTLGIAVKKVMLIEKRQ